jgi:hypothetical protein
MFNMLKTISLLVYISFIHTIYIGKLNPYFKKEAGNLLAAAAVPVAVPVAVPTATATENITKVRPMRGKQCNFKCDCFFSHSVKNDNICVPIWIKPLGL